MLKKILLLVATALTLSQLTGCVTDDAVSYLPKMTTIEEAESYFGTQHVTIPLVDGTILYKWDNVGEPYYVQPTCQQVQTGTNSWSTGQQDQGGNWITQTSPIYEQQCTQGYWTKNECYIFVTTDRNGSVISTKATGNSRGRCDGLLQRKIGD